MELDNVEEDFNIDVIQKNATTYSSDYYYEYYEDSPDEYEAVMEILEKEHEYELQNLNNWEEQLELDKNNYETVYGQRFSA